MTIPKIIYKLSSMILSAKYVEYNTLHRLLIWIVVKKTYQLQRLSKFIKKLLISTVVKNRNQLQRLSDFINNNHFDSCYKYKYRIFFATVIFIKGLSTFR